MYLLLDVVINHMAASALPTPFSAYTPFNQPAEFHPFCFITDYTNQVRLTKYAMDACIESVANRPMLNNVPLATPMSRSQI
jgi:hypothetical protein